MTKRLWLVPLIAAALAGCSDEHPVSRNCVDPHGVAIDPHNCEDMYRHGGYVPGHANWYYYWYYMNSPRPVAYGAAVPGGGSSVAPEGASFGADGVGVARGGFGSSAAGHGGGEGE
jgi:hypothetical protein